jgi:hypothetical protein
MRDVLCSFDSGPTTLSASGSVEWNSTASDVQDMENRRKRPRSRFGCVTRFPRSHYHRSGADDDARSISGGTGDNTIQMGTGDPMTTTKLKDEIRSALKQGAPPGELVTIVLRHKACGASQRAIYDTLLEIWIELGCDNDDEGPLCEALGDLMDRVWGISPGGRKPLWDSSLSEPPRE